MPINTVFNGVTYPIPQPGDTGWGTTLTNYFIAIASGALQKTGGAFTLTAEVNFGNSFGIKSLYVKSTGSNPASDGVFRLANAEAISWRNALNSADLDLEVDNTNTLLYNGNAVLTGTAGVLAPALGGTGISSYTAGDMLYATAATVLAKLAIGAADRVMTSSGTAPAWALLVNANVDAAAAIVYSKLSLADSILNADINSAAAIARSKLASGTADHVVINDGSGVLSSEAQLITTRGGTGLGSYTAGDLVYYASGTALSKLAASGNGLKHLRMNSGATAPEWVNEFSPKVQSVSAEATLTGADSGVIYDATSGAISQSISPSTLSGKLIFFQKSDSSTNAVTLTPTSGTIGGAASTKLMTAGETLTVYCDGTNFIVTQRRTNTPWTTFTPTITGCGTVSSNVGWWRRVGDNIEQRGIFTSGTSTAVLPYVGLARGTIDTAKLNTTRTSLLGFLCKGDSTSTLVPATSRGPWPMFVDNSVTNAVSWTNTIDTDSNFFHNINADTFISSGNVVSWSFSVPITDWAS